MDNEKEVDPSTIDPPGSLPDEVEYDGTGEFGTAEEAETDDFEVDDEDEEWGL